MYEIVIDFAEEKERSENWLVKKVLEKYLKSDVDE